MELHYGKFQTLIVYTIVQVKIFYHDKTPQLKRKTLNGFLLVKFDNQFISNLVVISLHGNKSIYGQMKDWKVPVLRKTK